jgi:hypothetical protein
MHPTMDGSGTYSVVNTYHLHARWRWCKTSAHVFIHTTHHPPLRACVNSMRGRPENCGNNAQDIVCGQIFCGQIFMATLHVHNSVARFLWPRYVSIILWPDFYGHISCQKNLWPDFYGHISCQEIWGKNVAIFFLATYMVRFLWSYHGHIFYGHIHGHISVVISWP